MTRWYAPRANVLAGRGAEEYPEGWRFGKTVQRTAMCSTYSDRPGKVVATAYEDNFVAPCSCHPF